MCMQKGSAVVPASRATSCTPHTGFYGEEEDVVV
jgi:hypothetical protein